MCSCAPARRPRLGPGLEASSSRLAEPRSLHVTTVPPRRQSQHIAVHRLPHLVRLVLSGVDHVTVYEVSLRFFVLGAENVFLVGVWNSTSAHHPRVGRLRITAGLHGVSTLQRAVAQSGVSDLAVSRSVMISHKTAHRFVVGV